MSFDFAVNDGGSSEATTNDTEATPDFESNEVADLYLSFGDWKATLGTMLEALDLEPLKVYSDDTLEDVGRLLEEHSEAHYQQKLHLLAVLAKSTAGKMQRDNDHSIGLRDGKAPEEHFENSFSYALFSEDLPTIQWDDLDGGERENLEEMGIDPSTLGFDSTFGGPKLLMIGGSRLPIAVEDPDDFNEAISILQSIPDEPSAYTEDGFRESSDPSVFDGDDGGTYRDSTSKDDERWSDFNFAAEPDRIGEVNAEDIKADATNITSLRTIKTLISNELNGKDRSSVIDRLNQRRNASDVTGSEESEDTDDSDEPSVTDFDKERVKSLYDMSDLEADAVMYRINSKGQSKEEALDAVRSV